MRTLPIPLDAAVLEPAVLALALRVARSRSQSWVPQRRMPCRNDARRPPVDNRPCGAGAAFNSHF
jgi:hypothetical protein